MIKIGIGSDHGGFEMKEEIKKYLAGEGIDFVDFGDRKSTRLNSSHL